MHLFYCTVPKWYWQFAFLNNLVQSCLFHTLNFIDLTVEQVEPENNFSEAISACLEQALTLNPVKYSIRNILLANPLQFLLNKCQGVTVICST